ncbi:MAG: signal peptidase I [Gammaproteobacteria bacterium]|nr:MAG: signal peptidase I [Gammaproteobacteria bacterium]
MNFNFEFILVSIVFISGLLYLFDKIILRGRRDYDAKQPKIFEYAQSFFPILLLVLIIRSFLVEPFRIPSGSMLPTLLIGDFILVNKFSYGIRVPVINKKIVDISDPKRGDVAVFKYPQDPSLNYIKRVIGLPGDKIIYKNKQITVNGQLIKLSDEQEYSPPDGSHKTGQKQYEEHLTGIKHNILLNQSVDNKSYEYVVPVGSYFVMGDNRDNSSDSRFWGYVPAENLVGKAFMIWMSWDSYNTTVMLGRIGRLIN